MGLPPPEPRRLSRSSARAHRPRGANGGDLTIVSGPPRICQDCDLRSPVPTEMSGRGRENPTRPGPGAQRPTPRRWDGPQPSLASLRYNRPIPASIDRAPAPLRPFPTPAGSAKELAMTLVLREEDVRGLLTMEDCISWLEESFKAYAA